jgi:hypothetical protein
MVVGALIWTHVTPAFTGGDVDSDQGYGGELRVVGPWQGHDQVLWRRRAAEENQENLMQTARLALATTVIVVTTLIGSANAQGQPGAGKASEAKRAECRIEANRKGLVGAAKRTERQSFMQNCVHGSN